MTKIRQKGGRGMNEHMGRLSDVRQCLAEANMTVFNVTRVEHKCISPNACNEHILSVKF